MIPHTATDREMILQVIRGERPWLDLRPLGYDLRRDSTGYVAHCPPDSHTEMTATVYDLAKGLMANRDHPQQLREWAVFVEAADVDLDVENHPAGEILLDALWRASFGEPLGQKTVNVIEQLGKENQNHA